MSPEPRFADFEALYSQFSPLVRRTAFSLNGGEDLDDIVQESFVRIWKSGADFRGDSSLKTWIYRITLNCAREHRRKKGRLRAALSRLLFQPRQSSAPASQAGTHLSSALSLAMAGLNEGQREAVTLCYLEGLSMAEAATAAEAPEGTIKSRLHQARALLAVALSDFKEP
jgi:RNA polymerase sigma-70 factor (ECF subfamily)